jgi:hypothetical protein
VSLASAIASAIGDARHVIVSRAASPELKALLARHSPVEAPVVAGATVWHAAPPGLAFVETPNWWGLREAAPVTRPYVVLDRRCDEVVNGMPQRPDPAGWSARTELLRRCMRTAGQLAGAGPAHGDPEAPWGVLLLPVAAEAVEAACRARGIHELTALDPRLPELPGGLRLEAPEAAGAEWSAAVVASIAHEIERTGAT